MIYCNCPVCGSGVMEKIGGLDLEMKVKNEVLQIDYDNEDQKPIEIYVCSSDLCGHIEMAAAPGVLSRTKKQVKNYLYSQPHNA